MKFIFGGAYQGKLDFAREKYSLAEDDIFSCRHGCVPDFSKKCICGLENFCRSCVEGGEDALKILSGSRGEWENSIFICRDIFCGVVPMDREDRLWRESTGEVCRFLTSEAEEVWRVFCGLGIRLK